MLYQHPEDYTMFYIGDFEDLTAKFDLPLTPEPIGKAIEFRKDYKPSTHANGDQNAINN